MSFERTASASPPFRVAFVCTGNICRSPMAEVVFRRLAEEAGLGERIEVTSAATGDWHVGERADPRTLAVLEHHGYDGSAHRAKQFDPDVFEQLDLAVVFDRGQERILRAWAGSEQLRGKVHLLLGFDPAQAALVDVPDPYYSDESQFEITLDMVERACRALLAQIEPGLRSGAR